MSDTGGLTKARELVKDRGKRAKELKDEGRRVIGYFCCFPPVEIITACGAVPLRIMGSLREPITKADTYFEPVSSCGYVRSCFDIGLKGAYSFLDGVVVPHACECIHSMYEVWKYYIKPSYIRYLNVPSTTGSDSMRFFQTEIRLFRESLADFTGGKISEENLREAIMLHNRLRASLRELSSLRKREPPLVSGVEMMQVYIACQILRVEEAKELVDRVIEEVRGRKEGVKGRLRVLLFGGPTDDTPFVELLESTGVEVVMDDLCFGTRWYWEDVEEEGDPLEKLATRYLSKVRCPRTFMGVGKGRFDYLVKFAREYKAEAAIFYVLKYCDSFGFDIPDLAERLREAGLRVLYLEDDYSLSTIQSLRTRVEAFTEIK